ncbi:MAG: hypothetical protein WCF90_09745 [Methanomicrobiales archaeon]
MLCSGEWSSILTDNVIFFPDLTAAQEPLIGLAQNAFSDRIYGSDISFGILVNYALKHHFCQQPEPLLALLESSFSFLRSVIFRPMVEAPIRFRVRSLASDKVKDPVISVPFFFDPLCFIVIKAFTMTDLVYEIFPVIALAEKNKSGYIPPYDFLRRVTVDFPGPRNLAGDDPVKGFPANDIIRAYDKDTRFVILNSAFLRLTISINTDANFPCSRGVCRNCEIQVHGCEKGFQLFRVTGLCDKEV